MTGDRGYGVATVEAPDESRTAADRRRSLTEALGATEVTVEGAVLADGMSLDLPGAGERFVVPLERDGTVTLDGRYDVPVPGIARIPAGRSTTITADGDVAVLVVGTSAEGGGTEPVILDLATADYAVPDTSDVATAHLTSPLDARGCKVNARLLHPGQAVPLHTEGTQEELFVPLAAGASTRVGEETIDTPVGTVVRVGPETPRAARNDTAVDAYWVMVGAPPTGAPDDWNPSAEIVE